MPRATSQRILPLSPEAIAQVHSSKHITSLQGVVCALLENSLDAEASRVEVSVDWRKGGCIVNDNGHGIPSAEFREDGCLGKLYCTSKRSTEGVQASETHGSSGTFLAELAAMSLLSLTSTHHSQSAAAVLSIHQGKVIARRHPEPATSLVTPVREVGTEVTVRDLFGNMPVRIKQRALAGKASYEDDKSWHELKRGVVALLLAWPKSCSVKLRDTNAGSRTVSISGHHPGGPSALTMMSLNQLAGKLVKSDFRNALPILFQSGFAVPDSRSQWIPLSASTSAISLKGLICLDPAPTKQCQFLALGISPCCTTSGHNELYDTVTKVFANSTFGIVESSASVGMSEVAAKQAANRQTSKQLQVKKGVDRFPMYYIQLNFKDGSHTSALDLERLNDESLKAIVDILEAALTAWLEANHFRPRKGRQRRNERQEAPAGPLHASCVTYPNTPNSADRTHHNTPYRGKQGKVLDLSGKLVLDELILEPSLTADAEELSTLSKMRVGIPKDRPQSARFSARTHRDNLEAPRAKSATSSRPREAGIPMAVKKRRALQAASIEAGEFEKTGTGHTSLAGPVPVPGSPHTLGLARSKGQGEVPSSDCFGSIDDADLFIAEQAGCQTQKEQAGIDGNAIDDSVTWTDPTSKKVFRVNSRTGIVLPPSDQRYLDDTISTRQRAAIDTTLSSNGRPLGLARRSAITKKDRRDSAEWLPGFLEQWSNPVFAGQKEEAIPVPSCNGPGLMETDIHRKGCWHAHFDSKVDNGSAGTKLSKTALREAEVIAQVDTKFILCKMPASVDKLDERGTLVLIDQHAASERVMLENLLEELCAPPTNDATSIQSTSLRNETARAQSLVVEVSTREFDLFARYRAHFARWGVLYDLFGSDSQRSKESKIRITHLPTPVAERCANVPSLAIEMLRSEIWSLDDGPRKMASTVRTSAAGVGDEDQPLWLSLLSAIPPSLLALIHSRSCRSAVMFNDVLSREQCVELVKELGKCVFPFVCAHGRVSMVPLGDLRVASLEHVGQDNKSESQAMSAWLSSREEDGSR